MVAHRSIAFRIFVSALLAVCLASLVLVGGARRAAAQTYTVCYWTNAGADTNWSTAGNWACDTDATGSIPDDQFSIDGSNHGSLADGDSDTDVTQGPPPAGAIIDFPAGYPNGTAVTWDNGMTVGAAYDSITLESSAYTFTNSNQGQGITLTPTTNPVR